jgi:hypothetical protein
MRYGIFLLFLGLSIQLQAQIGWQFTNPIPVANGITYGYLRPKITLDANNQPVILWGKSNTHQIMVSTFNGVDFNTPVQINPAGTHPYMSSWYNADIKSAGDTIIAVFPTDVPANHVFLVKSTNGGNTWADTVRVDHIPPGGIAYFPSADINQAGDIAVTFMRHEAGWVNPRYVVTTSLDGGNIFNADTNASAIALGEVCDCCPAHLIYNNHTQVLTFRNNNANLREFYAAVSTNDGASFTGYNVDNQGWVYPACPSVAPSSFISGNRLNTAFMSGASGANRIYFSTSQINTQTVDFVQMVDPAVPAGTLQTHPKLAGKDSVMALVWNQTYSGETDVYFRFSKYGADSLMGPGINISASPAGIQQNADMVYANGIFHIVYQNVPTQQLYYIRAIMDEYVGISNLPTFTYSLHLANETVYLQLNNAEVWSNTPLQMFDARGSIVFSGHLDQAAQVQINLQGQASGIYWIKINNAEQPIRFFK